MDTATLRHALEVARHRIEADRLALVECHGHPRTGKIPPDDAPGLAALREYDDALNVINAALSGNAEPPKERVAVRVDWMRAALNIRRAGTPLETASKACKREKSWLGHVSRGEVTRIEYHDGLRLLEYHRKACGEKAHADLLKR